MKKLLDGGVIEKMGLTQIVTQVSDLSPDNEFVYTLQPQHRIPSLLHHIDKSNLEDYMLDDIFETYDDYDNDAVIIN